MMMMNTEEEDKTICNYKIRGIVILPKQKTSLIIYSTKHLKLRDFTDFRTYADIMFCKQLSRNTNSMYLAIS